MDEDHSEYLCDAHQRRKPNVSKTVTTTVTPLNNHIQFEPFHAVQHYSLELKLEVVALVTS